MTCAMKTNYIHSNNNNNRIKPTRAANIAAEIMEDAHPDMNFRYSVVRARVSAMIYKHPLATDSEIKRRFYNGLLGALFAA
jgi:hypothetical protein